VKIQKGKRSDVRGLKASKKRSASNGTKIRGIQEGNPITVKALSQSRVEAFSAKLHVGTVPLSGMATAIHSE
jgi:hypothetical protein